MAALKWDFTINIPLMFGGVGAIIAGSMWVSSIENRLTGVEKALKDIATTQAQVSDLKADLSGMKVRVGNNERRLDLLERSE